MTFSAQTHLKRGTPTGLPLPLPVIRVTQFTRNVFGFHRSHVTVWGREAGAERQRDIRANTVTICLPFAPSPPPANAGLSVNVRLPPCCLSSASSLTPSAPCDQSGHIRRAIGRMQTRCRRRGLASFARALDGCEQFASIAHSGSRQRAD